MSGALTDLVRRRIEENRVAHPDSPWLFPSDGASGHVAEIRADALGDLVGHALRHLYATLALEAGVPIAELKFLLNHAVSSGGVTMGYLHPSLDHLRGWQEKATAILAALGWDGIKAIGQLRGGRSDRCACPSTPDASTARVN